VNWRLEHCGQWVAGSVELSVALGLLSHPQTSSLQQAHSLYSLAVET
jgi:hypothetical protein